MPKKLSLALCIALGLSACGGGGSNVKSDPPPPPPPPPPAPVVDPTAIVVSSNMTVASGEAIAHPFVLEAGASLDNRGTVGAGVDTIAVRSDQPDASLINAGTILGDVDMGSGGPNHVTLVAGGVIRGDLDIRGRGSSLTLHGDAGTVQRYSQAVTGTTLLRNTLAKSGDGTWIIDRDGLGRLEEIELDGGSLRIVEGGPAGFFSWQSDGPGYWLMAYLRHGELVFDRSDDVVIRANLMSDESLGEDGVLVQAGTGTLVLAGGHQTPAGIRIERGTLQFDDTGDKNYSTNVSERRTDVENHGVMVFNTNQGITWSGSFSGTGSIVMDGSGFLILTGANTYTGDTIVKRGSVGASTFLPGNVTVDVGGAFSPTSVGGDVFNAGKVSTDTWFKDADVEHITVGGNYHQAATGTLRLVVGTQLDVSGTATLEGGTLELYYQTEGYVANDHTVVLTAAGGLAGTFDQIIDGSWETRPLTFTVTSINYDANSVWLETQALDVTVAAAGNGIGYTPASMSSAERVQGAFEQLNQRIATDNLAGVSGDFLHSAGQFQRAPSIEAAQASLRSLSGQLHAASTAMAFRAIDAGNQALSDHLDGLRDGHASVGMWTQQLGSDGGMARSGFDSLGFQLDGWLVGNDYRVGNAGVAGFAFGQGRGRQQLQHGIDNNDSRRTEGMFYAGVASDSWYTQGRLGFGHFRQDVSRRLLLGDSTEGVWTRYAGRYQVAYGESGLRFGNAAMRIAPFVSVEYARSDRDAFAEEGAGGFGLRSDAQAMERWQAAVGVRAMRHWNFGGGRTLDFGVHAKWHHALDSTGDDMEASFVGLQQWSPLLGVGLSRYGGMFGVGLDARLSPRARLKLSYDYERGQYDSAQGMSVGLNVAF